MGTFLYNGVSGGVDYIIVSAGTAVMNDIAGYLDIPKKRAQGLALVCLTKAVEN